MQIDIKTIISFLAVAFPDRMGNAESCEAKGARLYTEVGIILLFLLTLAPSDG